jgi:hypothetical protein
MPITLTPAINAGVIDLAGNTYVTAAEAKTYLDQRAGGGDWFNYGADDHARALISAAISLDESRRWIGGLVREDQPLQWPRVAIRPVERRTRRLIRTGFETLTGASGGLYDMKGRFWAATAIPKPIKNAQCELAFELLVAGLPLSGRPGIKSFSQDGVSVTYDKPVERTDLSVIVARLLAPLSYGGPEMERG